MSEYKLSLKGLDCAGCAAELAEKIGRLEGIESCRIDFMSGRCVYSCAPENQQRLISRIREIIHEQEPDVVVTEEHQKQAAEEEEESASRRIPIMIAGAVLFVISLFLKGNAKAIISVAAYLVLGYDVLLAAFRSMGHGQLFDENFLMTVATVAALYLQEWSEAAAVMLFYQVGEYFQDMAVEKSRKSIGALMNIRPDFAVVQRDGAYVQVAPEEVQVGEIIRVKPGERVPLDGTVSAGASSLDTASLTGESRLRDADVGDEVLSGSVNQTGVLEIRVTKAYGESTVARILNLVENSESNKADAEKFITKFSRVYTPVVVLAAVLVALIVGLSGAGVNEGIRRACTFLVISCPCALVISIPLSFFGGIGGLSSRGVLVKGANVIEQLAKVRTVVMDKTGTLTSGTFAVESVLSSTDEQQALKDAACAEHFSNHPIAKGIQAAWKGTIADGEVRNVKEIAGRGMQAEVGGHTVLAGNLKLMQDHGVDCREEKAAGTLVYVARDGNYEGCLVLQDQLKPSSIQAVRDLHADGRKCVMISGDNPEISAAVGKRLGVDQAIGGCLPEDKVTAVQKLKQDGTTVFVGDGVNDVPVIAAADIGFAMGGLGSDAAVEASDVVIMDDDPAKISLAITSARRILGVANQNIWFAILVKVGTLILGGLGIANMWMAIFADTGVAMLCALNSLRLLRIARKQTPAAA